VTGARELLEAAIARAHAEVPDPLICPHCSCSIVVVRYRAGYGWLPVSCHLAECSALAGGPETLEAHEALWAVLEIRILVADYLEQADVLAAVS
jgi:hypothetical protein